MLHRAARNAYSWWWASHIRTKQSKWLDENLHGQFFISIIISIYVYLVYDMMQSLIYIITNIFLRFLKTGSFIKKITEY